MEALNDQRTREWDAKVAVTLKRVGKLAWFYTIAGYVVYGGGSAVMFYFLHNQPGLLTLLIMFFFQLCLIYFGTQAVFRCIAGGFHVGLLANRESMPTFEKLAEVTGDPDKSPVVKELKQAALDIKDEGVKIRGELTRMADAFTAPITPPPPRVPVGAAHGGKEGNGAGE